MLQTKLSIPVVCLLLILFPAVVVAQVTLPAMFSDHMVLQRDVPLPVWGKSAPGKSITVSLGAQSQSTHADDAGTWNVRLPPQKAGGPLELTVKDDAGGNVVIHDVLIGEVWICSGQSNMEFQFVLSDHAEEESAKAELPMIRSFMVEHATSATPRFDVGGRWVECSSDSVQNMSAVAHYFAREVIRNQNVPVGLIQATWGGTPAESWTREAVMTNDVLLKPIMDRCLPPEQAVIQEAEYQKQLAIWEKTGPTQDPGNKGFDWGWAKPDLDISEWKSMKVPGTMESRGLNIDGAVWFRKSVEVPANLAGIDLVLNLSLVDDFDETYYNGERIGGIGRENRDAWKTPRVYRVPGKLVHAGTNIIAVRIFDQFLGGGFTGSSSDMKLSQTENSGKWSVKLAGDWKYKVEYAVENPTYPPAPAIPMGPHNQNYPSTLYNAMIHPLIPYAMRGVIWYQGESNADRAQQYQTLFPAMITDWRKQWGQGDFPFLFVQLANFMPRRDMPTESTWAELREAQLKTLALPHTGMAVAIDIGDANDIHPRNKQEVGRRLAIAAQSVAFAQTTVPGGPLFDRMEIRGSSISLQFRNIGSGLVSKDATTLPGFAIAGEDHKWVWADARIENNTVVVESKQVPNPVAVRYGWADNPLCTLYNKEGLPASPFRTDDWPLLTADRR